MSSAAFSIPPNVLRDNVYLLGIVKNMSHYATLGHSPKHSVSPTTAKWYAMALSRCTSLTSLVLDCRHINVDSMKILIEGAVKCPSLSSLTVNHGLSPALATVVASAMVPPPSSGHNKYARGEGIVNVVAASNQQHSSGGRLRSVHLNPTFLDTISVSILVECLERSKTIINFEVRAPTPQAQDCLSRYKSKIRMVLARNRAAQVRQKTARPMGVHGGMGGPQGPAAVDVRKVKAAVALGARPYQPLIQPQRNPPQQHHHPYQLKEATLMDVMLHHRHQPSNHHQQDEASPLPEKPNSQPSSGEATPYSPPVLTTQRVLDFYPSPPDGGQVQFVPAPPPSASAAVAAPAHGGKYQPYAAAGIAKAKAEMQPSVMTHLPTPSSMELDAKLQKARLLKQGGRHPLLNLDPNQPIASKPKLVPPTGQQGMVQGAAGLPPQSMFIPPPPPLVEAGGVAMVGTEQHINKKKFAPPSSGPNLPAAQMPDYAGGAAAGEKENVLQAYNPKRFAAFLANNSNTNSSKDSSSNISHSEEEDGVTTTTTTTAAAQGGGFKPTAPGSRVAAKPVVTSQAVSASAFLTQQNPGGGPVQPPSGRNYGTDYGNPNQHKNASVRRLLLQRLTEAEAALVSVEKEVSVCRQAVQQCFNVAKEFQ